MNIHLVTFSDENMTMAADICERSGRDHGVSAVWKWSKAELMQTDFYRDNKLLLDQPRGCGYWSWKPFIILHTLTTRAKEGDIVIYSDAGVEFVNNIRYAVDRMKEHVWLFGNMYQHEHWCKADILKVILNGKERSLDKQSQASVLIVKNTDWSRTFVKEWMHYCLQPGLIDDSPSKTTNHPEFKENRHDQAILTTLAYKYNLPLHWWPAMYNAGNFTYDKTGYRDDYPVLFHHHRMRNQDFAAGDDLNRHMQSYFRKKYKTEISYTELLT
jgi:hypothetical protein